LPDHSPPLKDGKRRWIASLGEGLIRKLLPPVCVLCGATGCGALDICAGCLQDLPRNDHACPLCATPSAPSQTRGAICPTCQRQPPPFTSSHVPFLYQDSIQSLVKGAKFQGRLNMARLLGLCLARSVREGAIDHPEIIIPVPLHARRLRERGYNQVLELGRPLSRELALPMAPHLCVRLRAITPQEKLSREERRRNVRGAFGLAQPLAARHLAILDDVVTTGSTATEIALLLRQAGAQRIDLWAVARTP